MRTKIQRQGHGMMRPLKALTATALGLLLFLGTSKAAQAQYNFTTIDAPEATFTAVNGNNVRGVAGEFDDADGNSHGFVLNKGVFSQIDAPDAEGYTSVNGINGKGELAGIYFANDRYFGYFWHKGEFTTIDSPDSTFTVANFLNARGEVVGYSRKELEPRHGFIWRKGAFTIVDVPDAGPRGTRLYGVNDKGKIVGSYADQDNHLHGFLLSKGVYTMIAPPGSENGYTFAQGINNRGQIVGFYATEPEGATHGFVLKDGVYATVDVPGSTRTEIYSINAKGEIVGVFDDEDGISHGFVGTPTQQK